MKMRIPTNKEYDKLVEVTGGDNAKMHWRHMLSYVNDTENQHNLPEGLRVCRGYFSAHEWFHFSVPLRSDSIGFRPTVDLAPASLPPGVKEGDAVVIGTLYMSGNPVHVPEFPTQYGDIENYIPGASLELRNPVAQDPKCQITGIYIGDGVIIADRVMLERISYLDIQKQVQKAEEQEYYKKEDLVQAMRSITEDPTCPIHLAAEIDQILQLTPTVKISCEKKKDVI